MKKNIKCNEINCSKIDPKYFEKKNKNQSVFDGKKWFETISSHLKEILSNKRKENAPSLGHISLKWNTKENVTLLLVT